MTTSRMMILAGVGETPKTSDVVTPWLMHIALENHHCY